MLPIVLFLVFLPPSLFIGYFYASPDTTDLTILSSVAVYATVIVGTAYLYRLGEKPSKNSLNIVSARPIAPTCSVYKTSLTRRSSPAGPYLLATLRSTPSRPNQATYPKFEWAPKSIPAPPFAQPTCKISDGPPVASENLRSTPLVFRHAKDSSNTIFWFGVAVLILFSCAYLVGLEAMSWFEQIDNDLTSRVENTLPDSCLKQIKNPTMLDPQAQATHVNIPHIITPICAQYISKLDALPSDIFPPLIPILDTSTKRGGRRPALRLDVPFWETSAPCTPIKRTRSILKAEHSPLEVSKCRRAGGKRVPQARPRPPNVSSSFATGGMAGPGISILS